METELKLLIDPSDTEALRKHPLFKRYASDPPQEQTLSGIYFDTPNYDLRRADAGLRVRQVGRDWVQTLKVGGQAVGGLHQRHGWETKVKRPHPRPGDLAQTDDSEKRSRKVDVMNDASTATTWPHELETSRPDISGDASFIRGYLDCRSKSDDIALDRLWRKFEPIALPCRK